MRNSWKKTAAFLLAFTLAAVPLSQTGAKDGLFGGRSIVAHAEVDISGNYIVVSSNDSGTLSSDMTCTDLSVYNNATLTINKGITLTLNINNFFDLFDSSKIELHGELAGSVSGEENTWGWDSYINVYLSDGAKYTVTGLSCEDGDNYLRYYGYDAATDGNGTVGVKNGDTAVTSESIGYKTTTYTYTATPASGYKFKNWTKGAGGEVIGTDASIDVTCEQNGQYQVYANFEEDVVDPTMTSASVTLNDGFGLNFYVDNITDATGYTVMFDGVCDENGTEAALTEKDGKFFATANVNAKDIKENIAATLYKDGVATDVTLTSSVDAYLTAALADTSFDDKTKALLEATQLYGCTADNYFNNAENDFNQMFGDFLTYAGLESDQTPLYAAINNAVANDNVNDEKVSLVLNSKVKLRIYSDNGTNENNYGKYSEITGLTPLTMGQNQTVGGCSVSGYTWVDRVLEKNEIDKNYYMAMALASYSVYVLGNATSVDVASVAITNAPTAAITVGNTGTLTATVSPDNATNKTVTWAVTEGTDVLSIDAATGEYEALKAGTAKVTATADGKTAECTITVMAENKETLTFSGGSFEYTYSGTHFSASGEADPMEGYFSVDKWQGITINALDNKTITKVEINWGWNSNKNTMTLSSGTFDGDKTITGVNATTLTIGSTSTAGFEINGVTIWYE